MVTNAAIKRAHHPEQKELRRQHILDAGRRLILESGYDRVSMAQIAVAAGVAKGTVYIYFPTKEALFLALISEEFVAVFNTVDESLEKLKAPATAETVAEVITQAPVSRPLFLRLVGLLHTVLEHNIEEDAARSFKALLRDHSAVTGAKLESLLPQLGELDGARLLLTIHSLTVGWRHTSEPAPVIRKVLEDPDLALFRADFETSFRATLEMVIRGWRKGG